MFKLESFALPLLANYLNKYIRDLRPDDLQLSLWRGEVVLNNLELRLDAIEEDLGIPFTFVSGNIQELRIRVPWTRLTTEPVVVSVNTMECIVTLAPIPDQNDLKNGISRGNSLAKLEKKQSTSNVPASQPPAGYVESLTTRVLNNIQINFSNLILRYTEEDFVLTALIKSAEYFTVNSLWEKSFVELSQSDTSLRKVLEIHDLHLSLNKSGASPAEVMPLLERTSVSCRFLTRYDSPDCRTVLSSAMNILFSELDINIRDSQIPMLRRIYDLLMTFQAGGFRSRVRGARTEKTDRAEKTDPDFDFVRDLEAQVPSSPTGSNSWTSWALSFIPMVPSEQDPNSPDGTDVVPVGTQPKASTFAVYASRATVTLMQTLPGSVKRIGGKFVPLLRLECQDVFLCTKSREAKFANFRAAFGSCLLTQLKDCPCGEKEVNDRISLRPILSFTDSRYSPTEREVFLYGSLFGSADDEKEVMDPRAPYGSFDAYLEGNTERSLLRNHGVCVVDLITVTEPSLTFVGNLASMTESDLEYSSFKQNQLLRVIVSPCFIIVNSSSLHRVSYFLDFLYRCPYPPYEKDARVEYKGLPSPAEDVSQLIGYTPKREMKIIIQKPTIVFVPPNHATLPKIPRPGGKIRPAPQLETVEVPAVVFQADIEISQSGPLYPLRIIDAVQRVDRSTSDVLRNKFMSHMSVAVLSAEVSLCMYLADYPPFRDIHHIVLPFNLNWSQSSPVDENIARKLWDVSSSSSLQCHELQISASLSELMLIHFCINGLLRDLGSYFERLTFHTVVRDVFQSGGPGGDSGIRVELKAGKMRLDWPTAMALTGSVGSLEVVLMVDEEPFSPGSPVPSFFRDRATLMARSSHRLIRSEDGCMRFASYEIGFERMTDPAASRNTMSLDFPEPVKLVFYSNFLQSFMKHLGTALQYHNELSYADRYLDVTSTPLPTALHQYPESRFMLSHRKIICDFCDPELHYLSFNIHSGKICYSQPHANLSTMAYEFRALLASFARSSRDPFAGPISGSVQMDAFGMEDSVLTFLNGNLKLVPVVISAAILNRVSSLSSRAIAIIKEFTDAMDNGYLKRQGKPRRPKLKVVPSKNDFRSINWNFRAVGSADELPRALEVGFYESESLQTMTWRYPELRIMSSVTVIPVPFQLLNDDVSPPTEIVCSLQYLKRPLNEFVNFCSFALSEASESTFQFPDITPEDSGRLQLSDVWRVRISRGLLNDTNSSDTEPYKLPPLPVSVRNLAGCMKIDSGVVAGLPSTTQVNCNVGYMSVGLLHHIPIKTGKSMIDGFTLDSSYPPDQEFAKMKLDKLSLSGRLLGGEDQTKASFESSFWAQIDFVNYKFLTIQPLLHSSFFNVSVAHAAEDKQYLQIKVESKTPLALSCGQNAVHSFSMAALSWNTAENEEGYSVPIMNHVVICNDTPHVLRIRQYTTDECIFLRPKQMHPYSWRSQRAQLKLQYSIDAVPNLWSDAVPIELTNHESVVHFAPESRFGLVQIVRPLNNIQRQVLLNTQLLVANKLSVPVETRLIVEHEGSSNPVIDVPLEGFTIPPRALRPTNHVYGKIRAMKVRVSDGVWSESVPLVRDGIFSCRVPQVGELQVDVLVRLTSVKDLPGAQLLIICPIVVCRNLLPQLVGLSFVDGSKVVSLDVDSGSLEEVSCTAATAEKEFTIKVGYGVNSEPVAINLPVILSQLSPLSKPERLSHLLSEQDFGEAPQNESKDDAGLPALIYDNCVIKFQRLLPYADTILMNIKPNGLIVTNKYDSDLVIYGEDDEVLALLPKGARSVLPFTEKGQLRVGSQINETVFLSDFVTVRPDQCARERMMDCTQMGVLLLDGYFTVTFWEKRNDSFMIHYLTLLLKRTDAIYLEIIGRWSVASPIPEPGLLMGLFVVPKVHPKMNYVQILSQAKPVPISAAGSCLNAVEFIPSNPQQEELDSSRFEDMRIQLCLGRVRGNEIEWSYPREISEPKNKKMRIVTVCVPGFLESAPRDYCYQISIMEEFGVCHLVVERSVPNLVVVNNCPYTLSYGEVSRKGVSVMEESMNFLPSPNVAAGEISAYSFPTRDAAFPDVLSDPLVHHLRIGRPIKTASTTDVIVWSSSSVDPLSSSNDRFLSVPGVCYLKLHFERSSRLSTTIIIDPLSRVGIPLQSNPEDVPIKRRSSTPILLEPVKGSPMNLAISCLFRNLSISIDDEITDPDIISEVLRCSIDDASIQFYCDGDRVKTHECAVNIGNIQVDNQMYESGFFDFPVILAKENPRLNPQSAVNVLCKLDPSTLAPDDVHISLAPMSVYLEDTLAFHLLKLVDTFLVPAIMVKKDSEKERPLGTRLAESRRRLSVERIHISPLELYLSLHASMKVFVALDQTPLSFGELEIHDINSTADQVVSFIVMHYVKGVLVRAGWVIASMDLLGNPSNLVRYLSNGCKDLFMRPLTSLHSGPISFMRGIAEGASSFLTNVSAGTITSVTNLAESVSRNLDWASLDSDHISMRMTVKYQQRPDGFTMGLKQGLSGFGMSLLGAVAGLVDQPMQAMMVPSMTSGQVFTGLVMGITKGLVGAISKPVAGAAGFISQTGQGILRGNGLLKFPPRRHAAVPTFLISQPESTLKYIWKVAPLLPQNVRTLAVIPATLLNTISGAVPESPGAVCLFLTDSALFLISPMDDEFRQAYSLSKLNMRISGRNVAEDGSGDQVHVTLLTESVGSEENGLMFVGTNTTQSVMETNHSRREYARDSYLLDWRDALLFEELFLVAKSGM